MTDEDIQAMAEKEFPQFSETDVALMQERRKSFIKGFKVRDKLLQSSMGEKMYKWEKASELKEINWPLCVRYDGGGAPYYETVCSMEELQKLVTDYNPIKQANKSVEELLVKRKKVTVDYPNSPFRVGDILEDCYKRANKECWQNQRTGAYHYLDANSYPAIFIDLAAPSVKEEDSWRQFLKIMLDAHVEFMPKHPPTHEDSELYMIMSKRIASQNKK